MSPPDWFDFATLLTLWILCFQYGFNHFVSPLYKARLLQRDGLPEAEAQEATNRLIGRMRWFVLVVLILSVVFGTYGFITSPESHQRCQVSPKAVVQGRSVKLPFRASR